MRIPRNSESRATPADYGYLVSTLLLACRCISLLSLCCIIADPNVIVPRRATRVSFRFARDNERDREKPDTGVDRRDAIMLPHHCHAALALFVIINHGPAWLRSVGTSNSMPNSDENSGKTELRAHAAIATTMLLLLTLNIKYIGVCTILLYPRVRKIFRFECCDIAILKERRKY